MKILKVLIDLLKFGKIEEPFDNNWPDIRREYNDKKRPGLIFTVPPEHIYLCPFEVERLQNEWDKKQDV
jgi:hypothetical protein